MDAYLQPRAQEASNQFGFDDAFSASRMKHAQKVGLLFDTYGTTMRFSTGFRMVFTPRDNVDAGIVIFEEGAFRIVRYSSRIRGLIHNPPFIDGNDRE